MSDKHTINSDDMGGCLVASNLQATADLIRAACVTAYNLTYNEFIAVMGFADDHYANSKFYKMKRNFSEWFCSLDSATSAKFAQYVIKRRAEDAKQADPA